MLAILILTAIVVSVAAVMLFGHPRGRVAPPPSIAVLPFVDLSAAADQDYLGDGITGQIIDAFSRIPDFQTIGRGSVFALEGNQQDVGDIGRRLNVRSVLEGSVQRDGSRVRVSARLLNAADGFQLWSQTYDREMTEIFAIEDEIPRAIVATLEIKLAQPLPSAPRTNLEAFNLYLQGRHWYFKGQPDDVRQSITFFEQAIEKDPRDALAYAGLAESYAWLGFFRDRPGEVMPKARAAADRAIELDSSLVSAYVARGEVESLYDYDFEAAQRDFTRALALNPSIALFPQALTYLAPLGRTREAVEEMKRARNFDPLNPVTNTSLGVTYLFDHQYDAAIAQLRQTIDMAPNYQEAHAVLFDAYIAAGHAAEARAERAHLAPSPTLDDVELFALEGKTDQARQALREWNRTPHPGFSSPVKLACADFAAGDDAEGFKELDRAYGEHDALLALARVWPGLDRVRSDPRFQALLAKMK